MMYYKIINEEGHFDLLHPDETQFMSWIEIYGDDGNLLKRVSVEGDDEFLLHEEMEPQEMAEELEDYMSKFIYLSNKKEIEEIIKILREHEKELKVGVIKHEIEEIEKKIKELEKKKESLIKQLNEVIE